MTIGYVKPTRKQTIMAILTYIPTGIVVLALVGAVAALCVLVAWPLKQLLAWALGKI